MDYIINFFMDLFESIKTVIKNIDPYSFRAVLFSVLSVLTFYKTIYKWIGIFVKAKKFKEAPKTKKYGIVIAARNEELVIGNLVDSLHSQTYPRENFTVFVVADNCDRIANGQDHDDRTADIAREHGAIVYERFCPEKARKGWALEFLFENIERDYGIQSFDGFLFFDADNVVAKDYLERMNEAFSTGVDGVIGYRNTKNFDQNCISAHYAIHFMRSSMTLHRPRGRLRLCTHIAGTGYLLSSEMLKDGWHYSCLTEDTQATMDFAVKGKRIEYCEAAEFYDEQPYQVKVMLRQRIRWAKGRMTCFFMYGFKLFYGLFRCFRKKKTVNEVPVAKPFESKNIISKFMDFCSFIVDVFAKGFSFIAKNFTNFDMIFYLLPISFIKKMIWIGYYAAEFIMGWYIGGFIAGVILPEGGVFPWIATIIQLLCGTLPSYIRNVIFGMLIVIREHKHIHCSNLKMVWFLITWPLHDMIYPFLCFASLFMHVTWKPIKHDVVKSIDDINEEKKKGTN